MQTDAGEATVEARRPARDPGVACQCEVQARADGRTVHGGDCGKRAAVDAEEAVVDRRQRAAVLVPAAHGTERPHVGTRAERRGRARDDDRADTVVILEAVDGGDDLADELRRERVPPFGIVEGEHGDALAPLDVERHGRYPRSRTTAGECRKNVSTSRWYVYSGSDEPMARSSRTLRAKASTAPAVVYL